MQKTYVAAVYPRFNGLYYTVRYLDFNDLRGENLDDLSNVDVLLQKDLQKIIKKMKSKKQPIPEPKLKKYPNFSSTYDDECHYYNITVKI